MYKHFAESGKFQQKAFVFHKSHGIIPSVTGAVIRAEPRGCADNGKRCFPSRRTWNHQKALLRQGGALSCPPQTSFACFCGIIPSRRKPKPCIASLRLTPERTLFPQFGADAPAAAPLLRFAQKNCGIMDAACGRQLQRRQTMLAAVSPRLPGYSQWESKRKKCLTEGSFDAKVSQCGG